jgi:hypothetical protein
MLGRRKRALALAACALVAIAVALVVGRGGGSAPVSAGINTSKTAADPDAAGGSQTRYGDPVTAAEAYEAASRTYPANVIPPAVADRAESTFHKIDTQTRDFERHGGFGHDNWQPYGPLTDAFEPGVLAFAGAPGTTASRITAMLISPTCGRDGCRMWVGAAGGGVWRTNNALARNPNWRYVSDELEQNSVGALTLDPTDPSGDTIYLATGEGNRCTSGCESGVGLYKSTDAGNHWRKLPDACVGPTCVTPGRDAFLGRGINRVVVDPTNARHIFVGSTQGVRGLSHVIGNGGQVRLEPGANPVGLYESTDGGNTFTMTWNGNDPSSLGITDVELDPQNPTTVYASAYDQGLWRRSPANDGASAFLQVFAPQFPTGDGRDRTTIAITVKNGKTRVYLGDGARNAAGRLGPTAANFWRVDDANQPAAALLASQTTGSATPDPATHQYPAFYSGWQKLTSSDPSNPYFPTIDYCTAQCWYDNELYSPAGMPDTIYVLGSYGYGELPCNTKGVGCGIGRSNGRAVLYSDTAGDPDAAHADRTFNDMTYDDQENGGDWCALGFAGLSDCTHAHDAIHPDEHTIVINPSNPSQFFEGSDGGVARTDGSYSDQSDECSENRGAGETPLNAASLAACKRLLSRVPSTVEHINKNLSETLQFENVAINPALSCEVMGGTQDNGTWTNYGGCPRGTWPQTIYGDGGNSGYDATQPTWRWNEFTSAFTDSNFRNGDPTKWVIASAPLVNSGEAVAFYWPQAGDPNPVPGTHPIYSGLQHVWRTWAFGAGTPDRVPQDTTPNIAFYEANCQEFTVTGDTAGCGDYQPLGGPQGTDQPGDLTGAVYGSDRTGGSLSWIARDRADHGTIWAATSAGRVFVTHNGDVVDPKAVLWHRIDNPSSPTRFPSGIYPDPRDPTHAWIAYSGYNAATPDTPGHVFDVREGGTAAGSGVFVNLNVERGTSAFPTPTNSGDLPVVDIVRDDAQHALYVATDFGVLRGEHDGRGRWTVSLNVPRMEITHLAISPSSRAPTCTASRHCQRILYAATHSQGIWKLRLRGGKHEH